MGRQRWRTIVAVVLIVVGCVLAPLAGVAVWARNQVTNTGRYVRTVAPLASDPAIQQAITDQITAQIFTDLDVGGLTNQAVDALATLALVFWGQPTGKTIAVLAGLLLVALALIEFLGQPPQPTIVAPPTQP